MNTTASKALFDSELPILRRNAQLSGWTIHIAEYPIVDVSFDDGKRTPLRLRLKAENWNDQPPSAELLEPNGAFIVPDGVPRGGVFNSGLHPRNQRPFVCMAGLLEYHTYPCHVSDSWENYKSRSGYNLTGILFQLWDSWKTTK